MSPKHPACWSCGYDMSALATPTCPECGHDTTSPPTINRVRHSTGMFFSTLGMLAIGGTAFVRFVLASKRGPPPSQAWLDLAVVTAIACPCGAFALWLLFWPPLDKSERSTSLAGSSLASVSIAATTAWLLWR